MIRRGDSSIEIGKDIYATHGRHDRLECPLTPVGCPFGPFSCDDLTLTRAELQNHLSDPAVSRQHAEQIHAAFDQRDRDDKKSRIGRPFDASSIQTIYWNGTKNRQFEFDAVDCRWALDLKFSDLLMYGSIELMLSRRHRIITDVKRPFTVRAVLQCSNDPYLTGSSSLHGYIMNLTRSLSCWEQKYHSLFSNLVRASYGIVTLYFPSSLDE